MSDALGAYSLHTLVCIQPPSYPNMADAQGKWHRDTDSEVALCSETLQVPLCPLSLGCSDTFWYLLTAACPKGRGHAVFC